MIRPTPISLCVCGRGSKKDLLLFLGRSKMIKVVVVGETGWLLGRLDELCPGVV